MAKKTIEARMKQRIDTKANWATENPVLLEGELGIVSDDKNLYKVGDGVTAWNGLPFRGFDGTLVHETGESENAAMSQKGVTEILTELAQEIETELSALGVKTNSNKTEITKLTEDINAVQSEIETLQTEMESQSELIEDLQNTKIDKEADDYYPQLSVGVADNLAGHEDATPSEIGFRRSGGGAILDGNARIESIKGNSVVWNQIVDNSAATSFKGGNTNTILSVEGDTYTLTAKAAGTIYAFYRTQDFIKTLVIGHKYLRLTEVRKSSNEPAHIQMFDIKGDSDTSISINDTWSIISSIFTITEITTATPFLRFIIHGVEVGDYMSFRKTTFVDLTKMFGAGNEPTTVEEFNARKPLGIDEYAYNEGEVIHNATDKIESVGVNQWDEEWELGEILQNGTPISSQTAIRSKNFNPIIEGQTYNLHATDVRILIYDKNYTFIDFWSSGTTGDRAFLIPQGYSYFKISSTSNYGGVYKGDICVNISDPSVNGKYFPYVKREQSLDIIRKYFPNGMKSAGNAHDEIRYNKTTQKWEAVKRIAEVDMGSLDWDRQTDVGEGYFRAIIAGMAINYNQLCAQYTHINGIRWKLVDKSIAIYNTTENRICVMDSAYTDAATFKAAMAGVMLYYELAEPIVTEIEETINLDYPVWNVGTEKASANVPSTPLKADIIYGFNAYGVIKELLARVASLEAANASLASQLASVTSHNEEV